MAEVRSARPVSLFRWLLSVALSLFAACLAAEETLPARAADLRYGEVLYHYHQGQALDALTLLAVAGEQGGIRGHGEHPRLIEGGLMLSWGMVNEAGALFSRLLADESPVAGVTEDVRNQAWFYLGKVHYLSEHPQRAYESLERVDTERLAENQPGLYHEWCYLRGELARRYQEYGGAEETQRLARLLPENSLWRVYLEYNLAMDEVSQGKDEAAESRLTALLEVLARDRESDDDTAAERQALASRIRLALARLTSARGQFDAALEVLSGLPVQGPVSDQGLYEYAVTAARAGEHGRAFAALQVLASRPETSPWLQPVPYARGYLLEQLQQPHAAMEAYREAASHYQAELERLASVRSSLSTSFVLDRLAFEQDGEGTLTDAYGRLRILPEDPQLASLLAREDFQRALAQWHELRTLARDLRAQQSQLEAFDTMLVTRRLQREERIAETRRVLESLQADQWVTRHRTFSRQIAQALEREDEAFFMSTPQKQMARRLAGIRAILDQLPDDERSAAQRQKYQRMQALLQWQLADQYGVNRWATQKQLNALDEAMSEFRQRLLRVEALMDTDKEAEQLAGRLASVRSRLQTLMERLDELQGSAKDQLVGLVDAELALWADRNRAYLVASRHARARLADALLQSSGDGGEQP